MYSVLNGKVVESTELSVPLSSITVSYGTMIFDAFRSYTDGQHHRFFRAKDHITRFLEGIEYFGTQVSLTEEKFPQLLAELLEANKTKCATYYKICAFWTEAPLGTSVLDLKNYETSFALIPSTKNLPFPTTSLKLKTVEMQRNPFPLPSRLKTAANYYHFRPVLAKALEDGYDNLIFVNSDGYVSEAVDSSIFVIKNGALVTPPLSEQILPSVTRDTVLKLCKLKGITVHERRIKHEELNHADSIFLCNSAFVIRQAGSVNGIALSETDSVYLKALVREFSAVVLPGNAAFALNSIDI